MGKLSDLGTVLEADVLVVGGGLAGTNAAIAAAEKGVRVVVSDKGAIERSGDVGGGVDHFMAFLNTGETWDTREAFLEYCWRVGKGTMDPAVVEKVVCQELPAALERMERIGVKMKKEDGTYHRTASMGQPGPYWINFNGKKIKHHLSAEVRRLGCKVLDKVVTTGLLVKNGQVAGATAFHIRTGEFFIIRAKAVIIATGNTNRIYENPRLSSFNTWLCPVNTGDGQAMAFRAGAALVNMEYMRMTMVPKGFSAPGFNAFTGLGARFMNGSGEYYMEKNHPNGNKAPRYDVVFQSLQEIKEGRGPLYIDCTGLPPETLAHLKRTLGYDKDTLPEYMEQRGEDIGQVPIEIMVSEGMQGGATEISGSGMKVDKRMASNVPGLFAAGDCCDANRCVHGAVTGGYSSGKAAAEYASHTGTSEIDWEQVAREKERVFAPLQREDGLTYTELENMVRKVMSELVGVERNEIGLKTALQKLKQIKGYLNSLKAENLHELARTTETANLLQVAEISARAALFRKESRNKPYHYRLDYPEQDDQDWCGQVVVQKLHDRIDVSFLPITYTPTTKN